MGQISSWHPGEDASPTLVETAWERNMQLLGSQVYDAKMYRETGERKDASESKAGQKFITKSLVTLERAIECFQSKLITNKNERSERTARGTILIVPAGTLAVIALRPVLDRTYAAPEPELGVSYQTLTRMIGKAVEVELNFRNWIAASKESASEYAKREGLKGTPTSLAEKLVAENGASRQALQNWRKAFAELSEYKWNELSEYYAGDALLTCVTSALPEAFEVCWPVVNHRHPRKSVRMKPEFADNLDKEEGRYSASQAAKKPMITKPKPWVCTEN